MVNVAVIGFSRVDQATTVLASIDTHIVETIG